MDLLRGLCAFPITPATPEGAVIEADLRRILGRLAGAGVDSIGLLGSTGNYAYLTPQARRDALEIALDETGGRVPVIVGVGALRSADAVDLARHAREAGAQGLLLAPMTYQPLTPDEIVSHFRHVAEAGRLPLVIYNNPTTTRVVMDHELLARQAALPHVAGVKMPLPASDAIVGAELGALRAMLPPGFVIGYSGDWGCSRALLEGADTWFSVAAGLWPEPSVALARAACAGDAAGTQAAEARFQPLWALFRQHGSLRVVHAAARMMALTRADPQPPVLPLTDAALPALREAIRVLEA